MAPQAAAAAIWRFRSGEGQDIHVHVHKTLRRFAPFFEREWEKVNGRQASFASDPENPFIHHPSMTLWHKRLLEYLDWGDSEKKQACPIVFLVGIFLQPKQYSMYNLGYVHLY